MQHETGRGAVLHQATQLLSVETKPFDPNFYEDEVDEDEVMDDEGRARLKLKVENTLRWRYGKDREGNEIKESNSRIVKWSDGSMSLHLGNEIFDILKLPVQGQENHLFVQQGTGLQAQAVFKEKLSFRPHSTTSQTHRKMTMSIAERMNKQSKIRMMPATERDPEYAWKEMETKEDERQRAMRQREATQRRNREKQHAKGLTTNYLEQDMGDGGDGGDDDVEDSLAAIKKKYKEDLKGGNKGGGSDVSDIYSTSDSDSDVGSKIKKVSKPPSSASKQHPADKLGNEISDDDDFIDDGPIEKTSEKKKGTRKIIDDSDEESGDSG